MIKTDTIYEKFCNGDIIHYASDRQSVRCGLCGGPADAALAIGDTIDTSYGSAYDGSHFVWRHGRPDALKEDCFLCDRCIGSARMRKDLAYYRDDQRAVPELRDPLDQEAAFMVGARDACLLIGRSRGLPPYDISEKISDPEAFLQTFYGYTKKGFSLIHLLERRAFVSGTEPLGIHLDKQVELAPDGVPETSDVPLPLSWSVSDDFYAFGFRVALAMTAVQPALPSAAEFKTYLEEVRQRRPEEFAALGELPELDDQLPF